MPPAPEPRRRFPLVAVMGGVGVLLVCAGAALVMLRQQPAVSPQEPEPPPVVRAQPQPANAEPPERVEPPQPVRLKVLSEPAGAVVVVDGKQHGETPMDLPLTPDAPPVKVALKLDGYETEERRVSAGDAPELLVKLTPKASVQKPRRNPALDIKMGR